MINQKIILSFFVAILCLLAACAKDDAPESIPSDVNNTSVAEENTELALQTVMSTADASTPDEAIPIEGRVIDAII